MPHINNEEPRPIDLTERRSQKADMERSAALLESISARVMLAAGIVASADIANHDPADPPAMAKRLADEIPLPDRAVLPPVLGEIITVNFINNQRQQ